MGGKEEGKGVEEAGGGVKGRREAGGKGWGVYRRGVEKDCRAFMACQQGIRSQDKSLIN